MFEKLLLLINIITVSLALLVYPELKCLSSPVRTLSVVTGRNLGIMGAISILTLLYGILPLLTFATILIGFKRYIFSHHKSIRFSYVLIVELYLLSFSCSLFFLIFDFILRLGYIKNYYFNIRLLSLFPGHYGTYAKTFSMLSIFLLQSLFFIIMFFLIESYIALKQHHFTRSTNAFIRNNRLAIAFISMVAVFYLLILAMLEYNFYVFSKKTWSFIISSMGLLHYTLCPNIAMIYIYLLVVSNGI
ncbi:hypothetical protein PAEPH01_1862 [Pancytospora epiphaga]|nr:hypothetical protein PAEPH01_1862 [Pancytospora epiphaga]